MKNNNFVHFIFTCLSLLITAPSFATVPLYSDNSNRVLFSAQIQAAAFRDKTHLSATSTEPRSSDDWQMSSNQTWIHFEMQHQASANIAAFAVLEWLLDPFVYSNDINHDTSQNLFENRLGYLGLKGDLLGSLSFGKQWSASYQLLGSTDKLFVAKPDASGVYQLNDGGLSGNGRLDEGVIYQHAYGHLTFAVQYGDTVPLSQELTREKNAGAMLSYHFDMGLKIGGGYSESTLGTVGGSSKRYLGLKPDDKMATSNISAVYRSDHSYIALNFVKGNRAFVTGYNGNTSVLGEQAVLADAKGADIYLHYQFSNRMQPYFYYSYLNFADELINDSEVSGQRQMIAGGLLFNITEQLSFGIEYWHVDFEQLNKQSLGNSKVTALQLQYLL